MIAPELSVVVPAFNESANLAPLVGRLLEVLQSQACTCEILLVNDGSIDDTADVANALACQYPQVRPIHFTRNFGKEAALVAGMDAASGRAVLFMDADLQHPPELITQMLQAWRSGVQIVNAVKRRRGREPWLYRWSSKLFNRGMSASLRFNMAGSSDYKLLDRCVIESLRNLPERVRFFRGLVAWVGFQQIKIEFDVAQRHTGQTTWSSRDLLRYTLRNLLAFSSTPLYVVAVMGLVMAVLSTAMLLQTLYSYFVTGAAVGFTTVIALQVILGGAVLSALGILAAYLALIYEEVKGRPMYVINPASSSAIVPPPQPMANPAPIVSVVIASYNHAPFIEACLHSVLSQDMVSLEIIVTDDGSSDDTAARVAALAAQQARLPQQPQIHLHTFAQNRGACAAMNDAIRRARGRFIAVLNSDDQFLPGKLHKQLAFMAQNPQVGAVFGWPTFINEQGQPFSDEAHKDHAVFHQPNRTRHQWLRHFFDQGNALCHPTAFIRREVYERVGLYDPRLAQVPDLDQWMRVCMHFDIHVLPEPLTAFRIRDQLQNASAARPEVVIRDAWERARILRHYLQLSPADFQQVFPELAHPSGQTAEQLARYALTLNYPFYHRFALDAWFDSLPAGGTPSAPPPNLDPSAWRRLIAATGAHDLHRLYP